MWAASDLCPAADAIVDSSHAGFVQGVAERALHLMGVATVHRGGHRSRIG